MKQASGDLWNRYVDQSQWQRDGKYQVLEIAGFVIAIGPGIDDVERHVWKWSIYRGKPEWHLYLLKGVWSQIDYADENEARAAAWTTLMRILDPNDRAPRMQPREIEAHLAARKAEAPRIDATSCEVVVVRAGTLDPYGVLGIDEDGAQWFAQNPPNGLWVWSGDLPEQTREAIEERQKREPFFGYYAS